MCRGIFGALLVAASLLTAPVVALEWDNEEIELHDLTLRQYFDGADPQDEFRFLPVQRRGGYRAPSYNYSRSYSSRSYSSSAYRRPPVQRAQPLQARPLRAPAARLSPQPLTRSSARSSSFVPRSLTRGSSSAVSPLRSRPSALPARFSSLRQGAGLTRSGTTVRSLRNTVRAQGLSRSGTSTAAVRMARMQRAGISRATTRAAATFGKAKPAGIRAATKHANDNKAAQRTANARSTSGAGGAGGSGRRGSGGPGKALHIYAMGKNFTVAGSRNVHGLTIAFSKPTLKSPANRQVAIARKQVERRMAGLNKARVNNNVPALRREYISKVRALAGKGAQMRKSGSTPEQIARALHAERRMLGEHYKDITPPKELANIYKRNLEKYGDKLGPSIERLRAQGKSWEQIIETASTPGGTDMWW